MKLTKFQITNFRSVVDSGWIDADGVTALVGVNESGKTNLLLPLWKLNPASEGEIKPTSDYPKANYAAVRAAPGEFRFIAARFDSSDLASALSKMTGVALEALSEVEVSKYFDGGYTISFPRHAPVTSIARSQVSDVL